MYYLDATGKILDCDYLSIASSMTPTIIQSGQEIKHGVSGDINFPEETVKILIYIDRVI